MSVELIDGAARMPVALVDISMGGARVALPEGQRLTTPIVTLRLQNGVPDLRLVVKDADKTMARGKWDLPEQARKALGAFVEAVERQGRVLRAAAE